jgi:opacity protein-like surface antigen
MILALMAVSTLAEAANLGSAYRGREGMYEITLQPRYILSKDIDAGGGSKLELDSTFGFGLGFGYNFTNNFALHLEGSWASEGYSATVPTSIGGFPTGTTSVKGTMDTYTTALNLSYYFLDGPVTPFLMGGIGWTWVDSNIPSGPPTGTCWYDPWYGYVCTSYQSTYTKDYLSYNLGVGVRWDVQPGFFVRGIVDWQWLDLGTVGSNYFLGGRVDLGFTF